MKRCILVGGGDFCEEKFKQTQHSGVVVAVDGGYQYVKDIADVVCVIGDFDSLGYVPADIPVVRHDPVKDHTDMSLAINYLSEKGYDEFIIFGGLGGRLDHTIANLQMAHGFLKDSDIVIIFIDRDQEIRFISDEFVVLDGKEGDLFSLFAFDKCKGVNVSGAKYELHDHTLINTFPLGVSNEFAGGECRISVEEGVLIFIRMTKGK
ncbi:MAG: thiamine diphosphokinase [Clostridia bacterium]|nr:thiamine diphosphokinase [Clostridia bacterium]